MIHRACLLTWRGFFRDALLIFCGAKSRGRERSDPPRRGALGGRGDAVAVCQREPTHAPTPRSRMATALDPRRRRAQDHKHSRPPSPPKPRTGGEAQAPCGAAGPRRSARIMACSGWRGGIPRNQSSAVHYLPLSESGAPDGSPIQDGHRKAYW